MLRKHLLVWKVNAVFLAILILVFGILGYATNVVYERDALASARDVSIVNSETILQSTRLLMMTRDNAGIRGLIARLARDNPIYRDIRLASHGGGVVASRADPGDAVLRRDAWPCSACHAHPDPAEGLAVRTHDQVITLQSGGRIVSVVTPVLNEASCSSADCHAHPAESRVLGLLQADFSLSRVDDLIAQRNVHTAIAVLISVLLTTVGTWWMMERLVGGRMRALHEGMRRVARKDFSFRFRDRRGDEIAALAESFDEMTSELSSTLSELNNTKDYLQGIIENSTDLIITVDPSGRIRTFNTGAERILGYTRDEVIGRRIERLFADPREREVAIERLDHSDSVVNYETHFRAKDGAVRDVILSLSRLRDPDGVPIGTFGISKDVTREKKLQVQLIQSERLAAIGQAVTGIEHAMKNMLNALQGGSYMVKTALAKNDRDMLVDGWNVVQEGIRNMTDLGSKMLRYVRDWTPELERTDLGELLAGIHSMLRAAARDHGVQLVLEVGSDLPPVLCDPELVHSVVMDLATNALDACAGKEYKGDERPEVLLHVDESPTDRVAVEVRDNGEGMTDSVKNNIFAPFFSTKKRVGTGMGLTLTKRVVESHGGSISVESRFGSGSTFRVLLPIDGPTAGTNGENCNVQASSGS